MFLSHQMCQISETRGMPDAGVQLQGILDSLCYCDGPLGSELGGTDIAIRLWAPTATQAKLSFMLYLISAR